MSPLERFFLTILSFEVWRLVVFAGCTAAAFFVTGLLFRSRREVNE